MKSISVKLGVMLLFIGLIFGHVEVWGVDWCHYGTSDMGQFYYDKDSLTYLPDGVARVWERVIKDEDLKKAFEEKKEATQKFIEGKVSGKKALSKEQSEILYEQWQKEFLRDLVVPEKRMLIELKCGEKMFRLISGVEYDEKGNAKKGLQLRNWNGYGLLQEHLRRGSITWYVQNLNKKGVETGSLQLKGESKKTR